MITSRLIPKGFKWLGRLEGCVRVELSLTHSEVLGGLGCLLRGFLLLVPLCLLAGSAHFKFKFN
jgi:hypothetical protein